LFFLWLRYQRHYGVAKALTKVFRRAEYLVQLERQVLGCADRPADLYIPDWVNNRRWGVDITAVAAHRGEGKEPRAKVVGALEGKTVSQSHPGFRSDNVVYSFAVSSFGNMGKKAKDLLTYLAVTIADHELISPHVVRQQIVWQIVSTAMRPVAGAISATLDQRGVERT